ncbi:hypothetical protein HHI36_008741 [Cryptolaemus montrouzieri]|uniref:tRNA pseudouridine synthase n=1 Tax=Cryptolaemus montrouzieri TaxID=559131 RepID=A0ABD2MU91_9CUCU
MQRYLLNVSYIGTNFRGFQRQLDGSLPRQDDPTTIQGCIEMGLNTLNTKNMPYIRSSSRTDAGVHALNSTCHVDLETYWGTPYEPQNITSALNRVFCKQNFPIKVVNTFGVPQTFDCRHDAIARTYLYRFVRIDPHPSAADPLLQHIPIEHYDRAWFATCTEFNEDRMKDATKLFHGFHDFRTFMGRGGQEKLINKITRRSITKLSIEKVPLDLCSKFSRPLYGFNGKAELQSYNIVVEASGFLYNQVSEF